MKFQLPDLPFAKDALEPYMSKETIEYHYGKHHQGYVDKLNELVAGTPYENQPLEKIILTSRGPLYENASQHWNHCFLWQSLAPKGKAKISGDLEDRIKTEFGSFSSFKEQFIEAGKKHFGSGWVWLVTDKKGKLAIETTTNGDTPLIRGKTALMTMDVWEHAYYVDYRNDREKFLKAMWDHVNWNLAADLVDLAS